MGNRWRKQRGIQSWLRLMVLGCTLPSVIMAAILIIHFYLRERTSIEQDTVGTARALMQAVDRDLIGVQSALQVLATSPSLQSGDLAAFHTQALSFVHTQNFSNVALDDASGQQLLNTLLPFNATLPRYSNRGLIKRAIETGQPAVSELHIGGVTHQLLISVVVPIFLPGKSAFALTGGLYPRDLGVLLSRQHLPPGWVMAIFDGTGTFVARSEDSERFVGQKALPGLLSRMAEVSEGAMDGVNRESVATITSFSRSALSGWSVAIGVPKADLVWDLHKSLWFGIITACGLLLFGMIWAHGIGRHISRSIEALKAPALALASDRRPVAMEARVAEVTEVSEVGEALIMTSALLDQRALERATALAEAQASASRLTERSVELERSNADLTQFAYVASHDLKAPLRAIGHLAEWIAADVAATARPETIENLALLHGRVERLQTLTDGLLAYARIGRRQIDLETIDVRSLIAEIVATLALPSGFEIVCADAPASIRTYRIPLEQVLTNLIANGVKHHDRSEGRITITMRVVDGIAEFRVSDDGPGIPAQFHDRIFGIFQTLASRDDVESSGLGLAIIKRNVEIHGGQVWVESTPSSRGACFVFTWRVDTD